MALSQSILDSLASGDYGKAFNEDLYQERTIIAYNSALQFLNHYYIDLVPEN